MAATDRITMTMRELDRFKFIQSVIDGVLKPWRVDRAERYARCAQKMPIYGWHGVHTQTGP